MIDIVCPCSTTEGGWCSDKWRQLRRFAQSPKKLDLEVRRTFEQRTMDR